MARGKVPQTSGVLMYLAAAALGIFLLAVRLLSALNLSMDVFEAEEQEAAQRGDRLLVDLEDRNRDRWRWFSGILRNASQRSRTQLDQQSVVQQFHGLKDMLGSNALDQRLKALEAGFLEVQSKMKNLSAISAATTPKPAGKRWRDDGRCGPAFRHQKNPGTCPTPELFVAEKTPTSQAFLSNSPCCSRTGWCGASAEHCECSLCVDFRKRQPAPKSSESTAPAAAQARIANTHPGLKPLKVLAKETGFDLHSVLGGVAQAADVHNRSEIMGAYLELLLPHLEQPPPAPIRVWQRPPERRITVDCDSPVDSMTRKLFRGKRKKPFKVIDVIPFAYELDLLEIRLYELEDLVDLFVISESTYTHRMTRKPLLLARNFERFKRWRSNIIYTVMDDPHLRHQYTKEAKPSQDWRNEFTLRWFPWERLVQALGGPPGNDTFIIHEDLDQIPAAEAIAHLKFCHWVKEDTPVGMPGIFWANNFRWVRNNIGPHIEGFPPPYYWWTSSVFMAKDIKIKEDGHSWMPFRTGAAWNLEVKEWAGCHVSYGVPPYLDMVKELGMAEGGEVPRADFPELALAIVEDPTQMEIFRACGIRACCWDDATDHRRFRASGEEWVPWFATANQERFPYLWPSEEEMSHCKEMQCNGECTDADKQHQEGYALNLIVERNGDNSES